MPWKILEGRCGFDQNGQFRLPEHVDEARRDHHAVRVDGARAGAAARSPIAAILPPRMPMSAGVPRRARSVDDVPVPDHHVIGLGGGGRGEEKQRKHRAHKRQYTQLG